MNLSVMLKRSRRSVSLRTEQKRPQFYRSNADNARLSVWRDAFAVPGQIAINNARHVVNLLIRQLPSLDNPGILTFFKLVMRGYVESGFLCIFKKRFIMFFTRVCSNSGQRSKRVIFNDHTK